MLHSRAVLAVSLLAACGDATQTTVTASDSAGDSSSTGAPTTIDPPTGSDSAPPTGTDPPTGGTGTATDSGTTTGTTAVTTDPTAVTGTSSTGEPETTDPVLTTTGTGPGADLGGGESTVGESSSEGGESSSGGAELCACPDIEVPLDDGIFVLSDDAELWKYFPDGNTFELLGELSCAGLFSTFSMAVDRQGFAWVQFTGGGQLRKVPVTDLTQCEDAGYVPGQQGVNNFGMAFVSNSALDPCDRIYGNTYSGIGGYKEGPNLGDFIEIDPDSLQVSKLGKTNFDGAELTGTGDGRAFIFGGAFPSKLVEANKLTGAQESVLPLNGIEINNSAFAFAFFAGDFYFFTDSDLDFTSSEVTHLDYDDSDMNGQQDITVLTDAAPLLIVGAGVSTCAPTAPQ